MTRSSADTDLGPGPHTAWEFFAAGQGPACPRAAGAWLDTPLHLYMFVLLLCSFLNQVLPKSMPACSGQGMHLLDRAGRVSACALGSTGSSATRLSSLGLGGQGAEQAVSTCPIPTQSAELGRGLHPNSNGKTGQLVFPHPFVTPTSITIHRDVLLWAGHQVTAPSGTSVPCAMLLFSPKQHFDKSQHSLDPA